MQFHPVSYEQLIAYAANDLPAMDCEEVARHVAICESCIATVSKFHTIRAILRGDDSRLPPPRTVSRAEAIYSRRRALGLQNKSRTQPRLVFLVPGLVVLFSLMFIAGLVVGSAKNAPPGSALYPIRFAVEGFQLTLSNAFKAMGIGEASVVPTIAPTPPPTVPAAVPDASIDASAPETGEMSFAD